MTDERNDPLDEMLRQAADDVGTSPRLRDRVNSVMEAFRNLAPAPAWLNQALTVGVARAALTGVTTRATGATVVSEAIQTSLPREFDPQVNVEADGITITVEIDVDPNFSDLWITVAIDDALIAAPFVSSADDRRLRVAVIPYGGAGPVDLTLVMKQPSESR